MRIVYLGNYFKQDIFPMRGIAQTLMREYCRKFSCEYNGVVIEDNFRKRLNEINEADVVFMNIDAAYEKEVYEIISEGLIEPCLIGISTELFDILDRKSIYDYFNYSGSYVREKLIKYNILDYLRCTISGSFTPLKDIPHIYYPYLFAPSVYKDKIPYVRDLFKSDLRITSESREKCCSVYKLSNEFRENICNHLEVLMSVTYGGRWRNNDNRVKFDYDFDIINDYYRNFEYVVAIENDFHPGWITEKLINPLIAGAIPIYYAPFEFPESFINPEACIVLDDGYMHKDSSILKDELEKDRRGVKVFSDKASENFEKMIEAWMSILNGVINSNKVTHLD